MTIRDNTTTGGDAGMHCPIDFAMNMFGDRWSLLLIRDMLFRGKRRYGDFLNSEEGISTNILAERLKRMQCMGLVEKFPDPENRRASLYLLTDKGLDLLPILLEVIRWGLTHDDQSAVPPPVASALVGDDGSLARQARARIQGERQALLAQNQA